MNNTPKETTAAEVVAEASAEAFAEALRADDLDQFNEPWVGVAASDEDFRLDEDEDDACVSEDGAMRGRGPGNTCGTDGLCVRPSHQKDQTR